MYQCTGIYNFIWCGNKLEIIQYIDWALSKGTFSFVYEVGSSFFNDRSLIDDIKISLKEI